MEAHDQPMMTAAANIPAVMKIYAAPRITSQPNQITDNPRTEKRPQRARGVDQPNGTAENIGRQQFRD